MNYKRSGLPIVGASWLMKKCSVELSRIDALVYDDDGLEIIMYVPTNYVD
jgi:hypothetical protein